MFVVILDADTQRRLLRHIGLTGVPTADAAGLCEVHRAFVSRVPFENLAVQLGESQPLDPSTLVRRVLDGRGGYCFEVNTVLQTLLETLGFVVERREAIVGPRGEYALGAPTNHMALVAHTPDAGPFIAEAGWGEGPLDPLALVEGKAISGVFERAIERDGDGWWVSQHKYGSSPGFRFADAPATLAAFAPHHRRLSTAPDSLFVKTLVVARVFDDRIVTLRARTLSVDGPGVRERLVLDDIEGFGTALDQQFGIDPGILGREWLGRLWAEAVKQHATHREAS